MNEQISDSTLLAGLDLHSSVLECCGHEKTIGDLCGLCYQTQMSVEGYRQRIAELEAALFAMCEIKKRHEDRPRTIYSATDAISALGGIYAILAKYS